MNREQLIQRVLLALPVAEREQLGPELAGTIADAGPISTPHFVRELFHLLRFGLSARAGMVADLGARRLLADGVIRGTIWILTLDLATLVCWRLTGGSPLANLTSICVLAAVVVTALFGFERVAGLGGLFWVGLRIPQLEVLTAPGRWVPPMLLLACSLAMMVFRPRRRSADPRRLAWLSVPTFLVAVYVLAGDDNGIAFFGLLAVILLVLAAALLMLPTDPRPAIAALLPMVYLGLSFERGNDFIPVLYFLLAPAGVIGLVLLRVRQVRAARIGPKRPDGGAYAARDATDAPRCPTCASVVLQGVQVPPGDQ